MLLAAKKDSLDKDLDEIRRVAKDEMEMIRQRTRRISGCIKDCKRSRTQLKKIATTYKQIFLMQTREQENEIKMQEVKMKLIQTASDLKGTLASGMFKPEMSIEDKIKYFTLEQIVSERDAEQEIRLLSEKYGFPYGEVSDCKKMYDAVDVDRTGTLMKHQFFLLMKKIARQTEKKSMLEAGITLSEEHLQGFWKQAKYLMVSDGLTFFEFAVWWLGDGDRPKPPTKKPLRPSVSGIEHIEHPPTIPRTEAATSSTKSQPLRRVVHKITEVKRIAHRRRSV
jgi:hypothetical protein